jgi:hypothetical chaperone protein
MKNNNVILAIDFGTSNSLVGAWSEGRRIDALPLDPTAADPTLLRTLLYFPDADTCYYGGEAIHQYLENDMEGRLFRSFKTHLPNQHYLGTMLEDRVLSLENMVGIFLLELKRRAEARLGVETDTAVIGRPARYSLDPVADGFALHRMQKAAEFAGFKNLRFVPEPLAAAFDYRRELKEEKLVLIGDFGGGTSDFTLIRIGPGAFRPEDVLGIEGCPLAGDALDSLFMSQRLNEHFGAKAKYRMLMSSNWLTMPNSITERLNQPAHIVHLKEKATYEFIREVRKGAQGEKEKAAIDRLFLLLEDQQIFSFFERIEQTKRQLSAQDQAEFRFDYPDLELVTTFKRAEFETWAQTTKEKIFAAMDECLKQAGMTPAQIDLVSLTGGSAQVPLIRAEFENRFGAEKLRAQSQFHSVLSGLVESAGFMAQGTL